MLNSIQLADKLFLRIKEQRLKKRQKLAQSTIGKFSTIKASAVALNPFILFDVAGSFALDTALISELSKIYGLKFKGESTRKIFKNISINNLFLNIIFCKNIINFFRPVIYPFFIRLSKTFSTPASYQYKSLIIYRYN